MSVLLLFMTPLQTARWAGEAEGGSTWGSHQGTVHHGLRQLHIVSRLIPRLRANDLRDLTGSLLKGVEQSIAGMGTSRSMASDDEMPPAV
ncbi:hypothetical protein H641_00854 [Cutibacterium granulosum DSM 20700]|nr:hypothetical protein H641_00854 [Cutibacterium granulosum DSM 20700]